MLLQVGTIIPEYELSVEVNGIPQHLWLSVDTKSGRVLRYKLREDGLIEKDSLGNALTEEVNIPVDDLHIYLVKPKTA